VQFVEPPDETNPSAHDPTVYKSLDDMQGLMVVAHTRRKCATIGTRSVQHVETCHPRNTTDRPEPSRSGG
jgi:hypothetical protein